MPAKLARRVSLLAVIAVLCLTTGHGHLRAQTADPGEPGPTAEGVPINPHQLPPIPRGETPQQVAGIPRLYPVDAATFGQLKAQAQQNAAAGAHRPGGTAGSGGGPVPKFDTLGLGDGGGWNPPDGGLAVGPTSMLVAVNEAFALYSRATTPPALTLGPISFTSFFGTTASTYDPRALFDAGNGAAGGYGGGSGRFVLLAATTTGSTRSSSFTLAVSQNDSPQSATSGWCRYQLNAVTGVGNVRAWADFPGLGMDGTNLYITSNQFAFGSNRFQYARLLVIPKSSVYPNASTGTCPAASYTNFANIKNPDGSTAFTVQPATQPDALPGSSASMHFVNAIWASGSQLAIRSLSPSPKPTLGAATWVTTSSYDLSADAPQPNSAGLIDTGDTRLLGAVERNGTIYTGNTTQHVSSSLSATANAYANAQWYAFAPSATTAAASAITDTNVAYFYPGVMPSGPNNTSGATAFVGLQFSGSGPTQAASAFAVAGATAPPYTPYAAGVGGYTLNGRWGDYPALSADPTNSSGAVRVLGEYAKATGAWGTAAAGLGPTGISTP
jgi:hypothetical protein